MESKGAKRLKRSESFLGIHFDFHADENCRNIGANTTREMIGNIVTQVRPDYIQCDCKGHPGYASYPTRVGTPAPGIRKDALRIWREVTAEYGVSLYMHYSGVLDRQAVKRHPSWARADAAGKPDEGVTSVFGPYADELLIPQLKELRDEYGVDGVWIDGECWATLPDYGSAVVERFREQTGIDTVPEKPSDPHYFEFLQFCREGFRQYLSHYVGELHRHSPGFEIASNWAYTSYMPEPAGVEVDFISGDYSPQNSVNTARFESRCMAGQGKPWDLMAWSFSCKWGEKCSSQKSVPQLEQEAAAVLSVGGGFQAYFTQKKDGSVKGWQIPLMAEVAKFCRVRQQACHRAEAVPQVAVLYSSEDFYRHNEKLFGTMQGQLAAARGTMMALLDSQYSVEVKMEHQIHGKMSRYPLIVSPEAESFTPGFREELLAYTENGGSLLIIGSRAAGQFERELGVSFTDGGAVNEGFWLEHDGRMCGISSRYRSVQPGEAAETFGRIYAEPDNTGAGLPAATIARYGRGRIAGVYFDCGERYENAGTATLRDFLGALAARLFKEPVVRVSGSHLVDVAVNTVGDRLAVNLMNTGGSHADRNVYVFDEIPPVGPLEITIESKTMPHRVTAAAQGVQLDYTYDGGKIRLTLPSLAIHEVILVE